MKKTFIFIYNVLLVILMTILSPILFWIVFYRFDKVGTLLGFGRIGAFNEPIRVQTNTKNVLWEGESHETPKAIQTMRVYSYHLEDGLLVIKVYRNDKKIEKLNKELSNKGEDDE